MTKRFLITIGIMGALGIVLGMVESLVLSGNISEKCISVFDTANEFLMFHTLALLGLAFMNRYVSRSYLNSIYYLFVIGIILFSGAQYIQSIKELTGFNPGSLNIIALVGGILLFAGWVTLIFSGVSYTHKKQHH
jgi:uncharacterized membrane protein YgdD (TMEM256/DUF423 family)